MAKITSKPSEAWLFGFNVISARERERTGYGPTRIDTKEVVLIALRSGKFGPRDFIGEDRTSNVDLSAAWLQVEAERVARRGEYARLLCPEPPLVFIPSNVGQQWGNERYEGIDPATPGIDERVRAFEQTAQFQPSFIAADEAATEPIMDITNMLPNFPADATIPCPWTAEEFQSDRWLKGERLGSRMKLTAARMPTGGGSLTTTVGRILLAGVYGYEVQLGESKHGKRVCAAELPAAFDLAAEMWRTMSAKERLAAAVVAYNSQVKEGWVPGSKLMQMPVEKPATGLSAKGHEIRVGDWVRLVVSPETSVTHVDVIMPSGNLSLYDYGGIHEANRFEHAFVDKSGRPIRAGALVRMNGTGSAVGDMTVEAFDPSRTDCIYIRATNGGSCYRTPKQLEVVERTGSGSSLAASVDRPFTTPRPASPPWPTPTERQEQRKDTPGHKEQVPGDAEAEGRPVVKPVPQLNAQAEEWCRLVAEEAAERWAERVAGGKVTWDRTHGKTDGLLVRFSAGDWSFEQGVRCDTDCDARSVGQGAAITAETFYGKHLVEQRNGARRR